jgi:predicted amidophosphoribosyltransferase
MSEYPGMEEYAKKYVTKDMVQRAALCCSMPPDNLELCPNCINKFPLLELGHKTKGMCNLCGSPDSWDVRYKKGVK